MHRTLHSPKRTGHGSRGPSETILRGQRCWLKYLPNDRYWTMSKEGCLDSGTGRPIGLVLCRAHAREWLKERQYIAETRIGCESVFLPPLLMGTEVDWLRSGRANMQSARVDPFPAKPAFHSTSTSRQPEGCPSSPLSPWRLARSIQM